MSRVTRACCNAALAALLAAVAAAQSHPLSAGKVSIVGDNPFRLHIQTSGPVAPQVQLVPNPERLVIDLPNAAPGPGFHGLAVKRGEIRGVRTSTFSTSPLVTRVVVDLTAPQSYQVAADPGGLLVTIANDSSPDNAETTVGWVSSTARPQAVSARGPMVVNTPALRQQRATSVNGVNVQFTHGQLSIHANNASLSEVLFQIQKTTGAEIAIPSGTEQERVAGDFGPGTSNEVLAQLLNGSQLNFVVIGSEADPNALRSVILSRKGADPDPPANSVQAYIPAPEPENVEPGNPDPSVRPVPAPLPQQQQIPADGPPPEPLQD